MGAPSEATMKHVDWDANLVRAAGVRPKHLVRLLGITRVTASNWMTGASRPHFLLAGRAEAVMAAIRSALNDKELPVSDNLPPVERSVKTLNIVRGRLPSFEEDPPLD